MLFESMEYGSLCSKCSMNYHTTLTFVSWMQFSFLPGGSRDLYVNLDGSMGPQSLRVHEQMSWHKQRCICQECRVIVLWKTKTSFSLYKNILFVISQCILKYRKLCTVYQTLMQSVVDHYFFLAKLFLVDVDSCDRI